MKKIFYILTIIFFVCDSSYAKRLDEMNSNTSPDITNDLIYSQDVSDTTEASTGTGKSLTIKNLLKAGKITVDGTNVGINSINPTQQLDVNGTVKATSFVGDGSGLTGVSGSASDTVYGPSWDGDTTGIASKNALYDKIETISSSGGGWTDGGSNIHQTTSTDNVGIGTINPISKLEVKGAITSYNTSSGYSVSQAPYEGLIATRGILPQSSSTNTQLMSRSVHFSRKHISSMKLAIPNWWVRDYPDLYEEGTGGNATVTASIEYPEGVFTQVLFNGSSTGTIPDMETLVSDYVNIDIPDNTQFWVRIYFLGASVVYVSNNATSSLGSGIETGTSGITDKTMSGTVTSSSNHFPPIALIGWTDEPSIAILGDSKAVGNADTTADSTGDFGNVARSIGPNYAYMNLAKGGDRANHFVDKSISSNRRDLLKYVTHVISTYGYNDSGDDAAEIIEANLVSIWTDIARMNKKVYQITHGPGGNSSDQFKTTVNQTPYVPNTQRKIDVNNFIRTKPSVLTDYFDVSDVVSSSRDSGLWAVDGTAFYMTADGSHESSNGYGIIRDSGVIPHNFATLNIFTNNGNVGVGTISPSQALQVVGTVSATAFVGDGSGLTGIPASGGWSDGGSNIYNTTTTDYVGIGTTTPTQALQVVGTVSATTFSGAGTGLTGTASSLTAGTVTTNANLSGDVTSSGNTTTIADSVTVTGWALGASTATTPAEDDNDTSVATTAYVQTEISGLGSGAWIDGGTNVYVSPTTDNVGIGTTTPNATLLIENVGTGNSFRVNDSASDSSPLVVTSNGNVGIGTLLPGVAFQVSGGLWLGPGANTDTLKISNSNGMTYQYVGNYETANRTFHNFSTYNHGGESGNQTTGLKSTTSSYQTGSGSFVRAIHGEATTVNPSGTTDNVYGVYGNTVRNGAGGTVTNSYGIYGASGTVTAGTVTNNFALGASGRSVFSGNVGIGSALTDPYVLIAPGTGGLNVSGNVGVGTWYPQQKLQVVGTISATSFVGDGSALTGVGSSGWVDGGTNIYASPTTDNVAIGTTTPTTKLTVAGTSTTTAGVIAGTGGAGFQDYVAQSSDPATPSAGYTRLFSSTNNGFTRVSHLNELGVPLVMGRDASFVVKNTTGSTLTKGSVVYVSGSSGNIPLVTLARSNSLTTLPALGIVLADITNNSFGYVMTSGIIDGINTSAFTSGDQLFVSSTTAGSFQNTRPAYPMFANRVGTVLVSGVGNGSIEVKVAPFIGGQETGTVAANYMFSGNVGVGTFSPSGSVEVVKSGSLAPLMVSATATGDGNYLIVNSAGNVGMGTVLPSAILDVVSANYPVAEFTRTSSATNTVLGAIKYKALSSATVADGFGVNFGAFIEGSGLAETQIGELAFIRDGANNSGAITFRPYATGTANERMRISSGGNVGIGTSKPLSLLAVGTAIPVASYTSVGSGDVYIQNDLEVDGTVYMDSCSGAGCGGASGWTDGGASITTTTTTDTVGIGTTTVADGILQVGGDNVTIGIGGTNTTATGAGELYVKGDLEVDGTITGDGSGITNLGASAWADGGTNVYVSPTTDNVGIGTTTPSTNFKADIRGNLYVSGNVGIGTLLPRGTLDLGPTGTVYAQTITGPTGPTILGTSNNVGIGTITAGSLLTVGSTGQVTVSSAGAVATSSTVSVADDAYAAGWNGSTAVPTKNAVYDKIETLGSGGWTDGGTNVYTTTTSDNVGIGTTSPGRSLQIYGSPEDSLVGISLYHAGTGGRDWVIGSSDNTNTIGGGKFSIFDNTSFEHRFTINSNGNVGIGSTSPNASLDIRNTTSSIGWTVQTAANQACNTTCTSGCVYGQDTGTSNGPIVNCSDASADRCLCAGSN